MREDPAELRVAKTEWGKGERRELFRRLDPQDRLILRNVMLIKINPLYLHRPSRHFVLQSQAVILVERRDPARSDARLGRRVMDKPVMIG